MALVLSEEQQLLKESADGFFAEKSPITAFRALRDAGDETGYDTALWDEMKEMGFTALLLSEDDGGTGFGWVGAGIVAEAMARTLAPSPFLASSITATAILQAAGSDLASAVASGEKTATLAIDESGHFAPETVKTKATEADGTWKLNGFKTFVPDGHVADTFIVTASLEDGSIGLFTVDKGTSGLIVDRTIMADSRNWAKVTFEGTEAIMLAADGWATLTPELDKATIVVAAELLGLSEAAFDITLAYLKERKQFGKIIGTYQALQHRASHLYGELAVTRSAILAALQAADASAPNLSAMASMAKARACKTAELATNEAIQMHGGIGMTDEYDVGFFIKRARALQNLYGGYNYHTDRFAKMNGY